MYMDSAAGRHLPPQRGDLGQHRQQHPAQHIAGDGLAHTYGNGVVGEGTGKGTGEAGLLEADDSAHDHGVAEDGGRGASHL